MLAVEAWARARRGSRGRRAGRARARRLRRRRDPRAREGHRPRRRRVRRRRAGERRAARGRVGALRAHVERRRRHRARAADDARARPLAGAAAAARERDREAGPRVPRHADGRAHARHPRRADHVRRQARALGACRCGATGSGWPGPGTTIAVGKLSGAVGTYSNVDPVGRALRVRAPRAAAGARHAGAAARPARRGHVRVRVDRGEHRDVRARDPPPAAHRGARGRGGVPRGQQKGSSAMPHKRNPIKSEQMCGLARVLRGNLQAALEDVALWHERDISHSSVERIIVPDSLMLAYYMLVKFRQVDREPARVSRAHVAQPRRVVRARVQPAGAARARRGGAAPRRGVPDRAAQRDAGVAGGAVVPRAARRRPRGARACSTTRGSTRAST